MFIQKWKKHIEMKLNFTRCVTYYYLTLQAEEQQLHGERVAYAQAASEKLADCIKLTQVYNTSYHDNDNPITLQDVNIHGIYYSDLAQNG